MWVDSAGGEALPEQVVVGGCEAGQVEGAGQVVEEGGLLGAGQGVRRQAVEGCGEGEGLGVGDQAPAGQGGGGRAFREVGVGDGEPVDDGRAEPRITERLRPAAELSLEAMATLFFSSRSVRTWNSSSAPL